MKRQTNKEQVYVINQPKHITSTIIVLGDIFPLPEDAHNDIEKLCDISDVLFIYAPTHFTHQEEINFNRFSSLYKSCAWIESGSCLGSTLLHMIEYDQEIFGCHRNTIIMNSSKLGNIDIDKLISISSSPLNRPILEIERLSSEEFYEIYSEEEYTNPILNYLKPKREALERAFCSYKVTSDLAMFREDTLNTILKFYDNPEDEFPKQYVRTFTEDNIMYMLGSLIKYIGIDYLDRNYKDIKL